MNSTIPPSEWSINRARIAAHNSFDLLWKFGHMKRSAAYAWLANSMGISRHDCHIKNFGVAECEEVIRHVEEYWDRLKHCEEME